MKKENDLFIDGSELLGRQLPEHVMKELERRRKCRRDIIASSVDIQFGLDKGTNNLRIHVKGMNGPSAPLTRRAVSQLFDLVGLPQRTRYAQWLVNNSREFKNKDGDAPHVNRSVLCRLFNHFFQQMKFTRLVRLTKDTAGNTYCRALLSNRYRIVDSYDLFFAILKALSQIEVGGEKPEVWHARLSEDRFYGYAVAPGISGQVDTARTFTDSQGFQARWQGLKGDVFNPAIVFGNSETGAGGIFIKQAVMRHVSRSYFISGDLVAERHVGGRMEADADLSEETIKTWNKAFFSEVQDHVKNAFDPERFKTMLDRLNGAARDNIEDGVTAAEALQVCYDLSESSKEELRNQFFKSGDFTRYGMMTAMTSVAAAGKINPDEAVALEETASQLAHVEMKDIFTKAAKTREASGPVQVKVKTMTRRKRRSVPATV